MIDMMRITLSLLICFGLTACDPQHTDPDEGPGQANARVTVITSNYPLYYFAGQIASGLSSEVIIKLPDIEGDPANWKPDSAAIAELQAADLVVLNGVGYEAWRSWVTLPENLLLDTSRGFTDRLIPLQNETVHQHGPAGEHSHKGHAFTVWLDPQLAAEQARSIHQALSRLLPGNDELLNSNLASLSEKLEQLDQAQEEAFGQLGSNTLLFSHPVYQYLRARYRIDGVSVHWEPGEMPATRDWLELGKILASDRAELMLWEDTPLEETRSRLLDLGIRSIPFRTASNRPAQGDYLDVMQNNVNRLAELAHTP